MKLAIITLMVFAPSLSMVVQQSEVTGKIDGRVLDLFGNPIAGAEVLVSRNGEIKRRLVSNQEGSYEASGLPPGTYGISANLRGFHRANRNAYLGPGEHIVADLGLRPGRLGPVEREAIVAGNVRQSNGKGVEGATITLMSAFNEEIREQTYANTAGRFELKVAESGQYIVYVSKPGFGVAVKAMTVPTKLPSEPVVLDFELSVLRR